MKMKSILIGSVDSSKVVLEEMIRLNFPVDLVFSLDERYSKNVSGYEPIHELAEAHHIPFRKFKNINEDLYVKEITDHQPDYIFVVGLSQLIKPEIIHAAKIGTIGFHPTPLPKFRGRAALVWQVLLGVRETKCSLFFIDEGMDSGNIVAQEAYVIEDSDYAIDVQEKSNEALQRMMHWVLPQMVNGTVTSVKQNEEEATYLLKRTPEDGQIDWQEPVDAIQRLIRAVSKPYPGAFTYYNGQQKLLFWRADYLENKKYVGIPGQIAQITNDYIDIVCKGGLLRVTEFENIDDVQMRVGYKFK